MSRYDVANRHQIPPDLPCCYNCRSLNWMIGIGQGLRCSESRNKWRIFPGQERKLERPAIPGIGEKCEFFVIKDRP